MFRIIAIRHRQKRTAEGEARPTQILIQAESGKQIAYDLEEDDDELDFRSGIYPAKWRAPQPEEDIAVFPERHLRWRKPRKGEVVDFGKINPYHVRHIGLTRVEILSKVPAAYDGLRTGDKVISILGGSGDLFMACLTRKAREIAAECYGVRPITLKLMREGKDKEDDTVRLIELFLAFPEEFHRLGPRREELVRVADACKARQNAQDARKTCGLRLYQRARTHAYLGEIEGSLRDYYLSLQATDQSFLAHVAEEEERNRDLKQAVEAVDLWDEVFAGVNGLGYTIAGGLIAGIGDISRFRKEPDFTGADTREKRHKARRRAQKRTIDAIVKFLGVHVRQGGQYADVPPEKAFPRLAEGGVDYNTGGRQALYQLADQFNRRPDSVWGQRLLQNKALFRQKHPEPVTVEKKDPKTGRTRKVVMYSDIHILRMAKWRTLTQFVRWLAKRWLDVEARYTTETAAAPQAAG